MVVSFDFLSLVSEDSSVSYFTGKGNPKGLLGGYTFTQLGALMWHVAYRRKGGTYPTSHQGTRT